MSQPVPAESVIRTPDQRLRVFVSSTLAELADERRAVARAVTSLGLAPVMFELGARPYPPQELYRAYLAQSDIFVGLYWQSYGWVGPGMDISGLEDEFRLSHGKPRLLYLKAPAPQREPRLADLIDELRAEGTDAYRTFRSTRELGRLVRDDLALLLSERFVLGGAAASIDEPERRTDAAPRTLPLASTSLIGRDGDVAEIEALIRRDDVRLVTITGPGGIGKTRLAVAVGEDLARTGRHVVFVPLAAVAEPSDVLNRVAVAAGAVLEGTRSPADALIDHFSAVPTLLILDNLEQVVAVAPLLDDLLAHSPGLQIVATSRIALRLRAEHEYVLSALSAGAPGAEVTDDEALAMPAVELFLDRANAVRRASSPRELDLAAVREICRRLDGVPLAIELAAARTRLLEPAAILTRLERVLDSLGTGPVDLPPRQRTLRGTVEWSVDLLGEDERQLLATLSVFEDGWTLAAGAAVSGEPEDTTLDLLDALAGQSLISVDARGIDPRFRMLNTVREFAAELLSEEDRADAAHRHAEFFADLAEEDVDGPHVAQWSEAVRADEENVRVAIRWFFEHDLTRLPHLFRSLWMYWQINDRIAQGQSAVRELNERMPDGLLDTTATAELLFMVGVCATEVGDDETALAALADIQPLVADVEEPALQDGLRLAMAWILPLTGDLDGAIAAAEAAHAGLARRGDKFLAVAALTLGMLNLADGQDAAARRHLMEEDALGDQLGMHWVTISARTHLAILDIRAGDEDRARAQLRRSLEGLDDTRVATLSACLILGAYGRLALAENRPLAAVAALGMMDGLRERAGVTPWPNARATEQGLREQAAALVRGEEWDSAYGSGHDLRVDAALARVRRDLGGDGPR